MIAVFGMTACSLDVNTSSDKKPAENKSAEKSAGDTVKAENEDAKDGDTEKNVVGSEKVPSSGSAAPEKAECLRATMRGKKLITSQTFVFDQEPFRGSCFVTFANPDDMVDTTDVPRGSTFHIYKDGKDVYDFEDAFGGQSACWVEGVGFEDLNGDGKTEVIVAGSCLGAKAGYPTNAVYINNGEDFTTDTAANESLSDFTKVKQIADYVKKNQGKFF